MTEREPCNFCGNPDRHDWRECDCPYPCSAPECAARAAQEPPGRLPMEEDWDDEPCRHICTEWCEEYGSCDHQHCFNCGGCGCPGYCDDYQTYNLRPAETGGAADG